MNIYLICLIIVLLIILIKQNIENYESYGPGFNFGPEYSFMANRSKCFSCEKDAIRNYGIEYAWLGQPAKVFSAQNHRIKMAGNPMAGNYEASNSCPSCYWQYQTVQKNKKNKKL
jgi:hypothetical protein